MRPTQGPDRTVKAIAKPLFNQLYLHLKLIPGHYYERGVAFVFKTALTVDKEQVNDIATGHCNVTVAYRCRHVSGKGRPYYGVMLQPLTHYRMTMSVKRYAHERNCCNQELTKSSVGCVSMCFINGVKSPNSCLPL